MALVTVVLVVGCSRTPNSDSSQAPQTVAPQPTAIETAAPNEIDKDAEAVYRNAITASQKSANSNGLTELWFDSEGQLVQVSVQDKSGSLYVTQDMLDESVYEVDESAMMPAMLLAELDALAVSGSNYGYVVFDELQRIEVSNTIDDIIYVTTYEISEDGLISKAIISAEAEPLGEITYSYSVTKEGQAALDAFSAAS